MKLQLVSFSLCPYVQRSIITLNFKNVPFILEEIDLSAPPLWFQEVSPLGKVPVLIVDGKTSIFESAVINEYIDEITEPRLHSKDPLQKALERAWIELSSELLSHFFHICMETEVTPFNQEKKEFFFLLSKVENILSGEDGFFRGQEFSLVDTSYAPLLMRLKLVPGIYQDPEFQKFRKLQKWTEKLIKLPAVRSSVKPNFIESFQKYLATEESIALKAPPVVNS